MPDRPLDLAAVEALLADLAGDLAWPAVPDAVAATRNRLVAGERARPHDARGRRLVWTVAALALVVAVVLALPGPRRAVADLLGLGGVQVRQVTTTVPVTTATTLDLGVATTLEAAVAAAPFEVYLPATLGSPSGVFLDSLGGRDVLSLTYPPQDGLPPTAGSDLGLLVTEFAGSVEPFVDKLVATGQARRFTIDGRPALWIEGPHTIFFDEGGDVVGTSEPRLAANTLVVTRGDTTVRLEGAFDEATAIGLAQSLEPLG